MGKGYFILLLLLFHSLVSMAQIPTKNYILGRQMLDANGVYAITTISSFDDLGLRNEQLLQANYYDNHAFINGQLEKQATSQNLASNQQAKEEYSKGSLTGTVSMATDGKPLVSVYYHDLKGQVIASKQTLPDDALLSQNMTYSFTKQPLEIISEIFKNGISTTVTQTNSYNKHNDKIETMTLKVGNVTRTVSSYSYNDISRLLSIKRSGNVLRGYDFAYDGLNCLDWYDHGARMYDAAKVAWDRVDRLAEKYNQLSPYLYCGNSPVVLLDDDGNKTRIYIETHGLGHTFVTVGEGRNTVVYTYGRYGALGCSGSVLHSFTPTGEGVLYRKTGKQAALYLNEEIEKVNLSIYTIEKGSDEKVADFFDKMWTNGYRPTEKKAKNDPNAKVVDEYDILDNNCTTKSIEALNYKQTKPVVPSSNSTTFYDLGGSYEYKDKIVAPITLKRKLDEMHRTNPHNVIKINNINEFIFNLQKQLSK